MCRIHGYTPRMRKHGGRTGTEMVVIKTGEGQRPAPPFLHCSMEA